MRAFIGLNAGLLIGAHDMHTLVVLIGVPVDTARRWSGRLCQMAWGLRRVGDSANRVIAVVSSPLLLKKRPTRRGEMLGTMASADHLRG